MIGHLLKQTLSVHRPKTAPDGAGGHTVEFSAMGTVQAQVNQPSAEERQVAQQQGAWLSHVVHLLPGADVRRGDELSGEIPSDVPAGHRLRVISTVTNSRETYLRAGCEVVQSAELEEA